VPAVAELEQGRESSAQRKWVYAYDRSGDAVERPTKAFSGSAPPMFGANAAPPWASKPVAAVEVPHGDPKLEVVVAQIVSQVSLVVDVPTAAITAITYKPGEEASSP
jgi:hypothetical protein